MHRDVHREAEPLGRTINDPAVKILLRAEGNGMEQCVEPTPFRADLGIESFQLARPADIERHEDLRLEFFGNRPHEPFRLFVEIGDCDIRPHLSHCARTAVGNGLIVRDTHNESLLARQ